MANKMVGKAKLPVESEDAQKLRFQVELEFVQCLANPNYLHFLAQRGFFKDSAFINYLKYLLYWKDPEYAKYLKYPMCLYFLDLLQYEHFRREIVNAQCCKFIDDQAILLWQHYTRRRTRLTSLGTTSLTGLAVGGQPVGGGVQGTLLSNDPAIAALTAASNNNNNNNTVNTNANNPGGGGQPGGQSGGGPGQQQNGGPIAQQNGLGNSTGMAGMVLGGGGGGGGTGGINLSGQKVS
ncbi:mediator of RNA polymerase II transcription subunit 31 isoform X1 [Culex pipiens pallens]|uniref:mediator of RNA polymerase II transcription subunit 31 isoform X1 n=1 Tax=Culex pipiens pallens TaxID=42434 RepID=UPI001953813E|nr:mediator of RNA polymerase II transcription subunit 31 isoform X1 [Culex pipiens pallens]XP_052566599.1 mediator of RNA polymerase II transcription subunit 31 isoform X1 [Culex pipiens pallens]